MTAEVMAQYAIAQKLEKEIKKLVRDPVVENYLVTNCHNAVSAANT